MTESQKSPRGSQGNSRTETTSGFENLANQALLSVAKSSPTSAPEGYEQVINSLAQVFTDSDSDERRKAVSDLIGSGVTSEEFVSHHAKDTARRLGDLWADNKISFVDVTIGVARLQETVRSVSVGQEHYNIEFSAPEILLVAPIQEDHIFGLFVLSEEVQRLGCAVQTAVGYNQKEVCDLVKKTKFDFVGISVSSRRNILHAKELVRAIRKSTLAGTKIVVGGGITNYPDIDAVEMTGADFVTSDPVEALETTGIASRLRRNAKT